MLRTSSVKTSSLLVAAAIAALAACGDDDPQAPISDPAEIRVVNVAEGPILFLFFRRCGEQIWGEDRLPAAGIGSTIASQDSSSFNVEAGCYDLRADVSPVPPPVLVDDTVVVVRPDANVSSLQPFRWEVAATPPAPSSVGPR